MKINLKGILKKTETESILKNGNSKNPVIFTACAIAGICAGTFCETLNNGVYTTIDVNYVDYLDKINNFNFVELTFNCAVYNMIFIFFAMILGLCAVGYMFLYVIPFFKGLGIGCMCSYIYSLYAVKGVLICSALIFIPSVIQLISIILACSESCLMSEDILRLIDKKEKENAEVQIKLYILRYLIISLIVMLSAVFYATLCRLFQ